MSSSLTGRLITGSKYLGKVLALSAVVAWPPMIVGRIVLGQPAMTMLLFGSMVGFLGTAVGGRRVGAAASLVFILVIPGAVMSGSNALAGASLMALACVMVGAATYWKRLSPFAPILAGVAFMLTAPRGLSEKMIGGPTETRYMLAVLAFTALCAFWPVVLLPFFLKMAPVSAQVHNSLSQTVIYTATLAIMVSAGTYYALEGGRTTHGVWLPLTLIMVLQVTPGATRHRIIQRVVGTIAGAVVAVLVATFVEPHWAVTLVLLVLLLGLYDRVGREPYELFAFFLTALVLLGASASESALVASEQRVLYTLAGVVLALVAMVIGEAIYRRVNPAPASGHHSEQPAETAGQAPQH
jgi:hypothetical protein